MRPGTPISDLFRVGVDTVRASGIPNFQRHHAGHGIGLEMYEAPLLNVSPMPASPPTSDSAACLQAGMVLNIELPYYEWGVGGLQIEETLVVRDGGYELLTTASRDLRPPGSGLVAR